MAGEGAVYIFRASNRDADKGPKEFESDKPSPLFAHGKGRPVKGGPVGMLKFALGLVRRLLVFGRKQQEPTTDRYYVQVVDLGYPLEPKKRAIQLQNALNAGDAKGWKLISIGDQEQIRMSPVAKTDTKERKIIIWDTCS